MSWEKNPGRIVARARVLRFEYFEGLGVVRQLDWDRLTDAQKLTWLLKAAEEVGVS